jgi:uncharacterized membrane protein (DUF485 family)
MIGVLSRKNIVESLVALRNALGRIVEREWQLSAKRLLWVALCVWLLIFDLLLFPYAQDIFGPDAFVFRAPFDASNWTDWVTRWVLHPAIYPYYKGVMALHVCALILGIWGKWPRFSAVLVYILTANLFSLSYATNDGGNNLAEVLLVYLMFVNTSGQAKQLRWASFSYIHNGVSNLAFLVCKIQIVLVYLSAGILKLNGELWQQGMALYYVLQSETFSTYWLAELALEYPLATMFGTYFVMAFQFAFPTLIWFAKTRPYVIVAGVLVHGIGIAFGMGLFLFGLVMCLVYVAFIEKQSANAIMQRLKPFGQTGSPTDVIPTGDAQ